MNNHDPTKLAGLLSEMRQMADGAELHDAMAAALFEELGSKARRAADGAWEAPATGALRVRRNGALEDWAKRGNICLAGEGAGEPIVGSGFSPVPASDGLLMLGQGAKLARATLSGAGGIIVVGDAANLHASSLSVSGASVIMIGEQTTSTFIAQLDARNGGAILVGADGQWANDLRMITDDMHAIRDLQTGKRLNRFGGRILVERHVWFGERVALLGDCRIGADTVVGMGSFVKGLELPSNAVCAGLPIRPIRTGTTWTREDAP